MIKKCLKCDKEFEAKKEMAKFCSTSCRVMYNRKQPKKNTVTPLQMQVLYNSVLEMVGKINYGQVPTNNTYSNPVVGESVKVKIAPEKPFQQHMNEIAELQFEDEFKKKASEIEFSSTLTRKQKDLLLTSMRASKL